MSEPDARENPRKSRRAYGTGSISERNGRYYGSWYVGPRKVQQVIGPVRSVGRADGYTKAMAEKRLRQMMLQRIEPQAAERLTVAEVGKRLIEQKRSLGRGANTIETYESYLRVHIEPVLGDRPIAKLTKDDIRAFMAGCSKNRQSLKSIKNYLGLIHGICEYAVREGWATSNPCKLVEKPQPVKSEEIHFLDRIELNRLLASGTEDTALGRIDALIYYTAAMTGLRQGELVGLRWMDVDWTARRIRVRQSYSRGKKGLPKSKLSSRSVPLANALGGHLDRHSQSTPWKADTDLVFAHPETGKPLERSRLLKRFKAAITKAQVGQFEPALDRAGKIIKDLNGQTVMRPVLTFHDLRHTFGTQMAADGIALRVIQEWMGHEDIKTTMIYADYMPAENEAQLIDRAMAGIELAGGSNFGSILSESERSSEHLSPVDTG